MLWREEGLWPDFVDRDRVGSALQAGDSWGLSNGNKLFGSPDI